MRMPLPHFPRLLLDRSDANQRAFPDAWTILRRLQPLPPVRYQLRPEWEDPALGWFRGMNRAAFTAQEMAVLSPRNPQSDLVSCPVDVLPFKNRSRHAQKFACAHQVGFR